VPEFSWQNQFMLGRLMEVFLAQDPQRLRTFFVLGQFGVGLLLVYLLFRFSSSKSESGFRLREADRPRRKRFGVRDDSLAQAKLGAKPGEKQSAKKPLQLEGIRIDRPPHEILGVPVSATPEEIQRAYRQLMKRYHPDRVGAPGSREWNDAQRIAEAINAAKDIVLKQKR
jgi:hypothetical protein